MPGLADLIDRLLVARETPTARGRAEAAALAEAVNELVATFNARLRRCGAYLDAGLRAEAVHAAAIAPVLLDTATVFTSAQWVACAADGIARPRVEEAVLARLRKAVADERVVDAAATAYRAALLARPPVVVRWQRLRAALAADPDPANWDDERRRVEPAALREVTASFEAAVRAGDESAARRWAETIDDDDAWLTPTANELRDRAAATLGPARRERAFAAFPLDALRDAREREDIVAVEALLDQWAALIEREQTEPPAAAAAVVRAANAWLVATLRRHDVARRRPIGPVNEEPTPAAKKKRFWS